MYGNGIYTVANSTYLSQTIARDTNRRMVLIHPFSMSRLWIHALCVWVAMVGVVSSEPTSPPTPAPANYVNGDTLGTTNSSIPLLFKKELQLYGNITEDKVFYFPAGDAVFRMEEKVGWDVKKSDFIHNGPLAELQSKSLKPKLVITREANTGIAVVNGRPIYDMMDIVIPSIRDLDFLEDWKVYIEPFHLILIQDGDPSKQLKIPEWADYVLYNREDINRTLGENAWIISSRDASIRNFGFLVSDKDYVYTLDDDCLPATHPITKRKVNAIEEHLLNLLSPSTPFFFNTVYDPFRTGVDFVRGYPYSMRDGVPTAISHGLWMNAYDYDAPTQLLKVQERNTFYHDMTQTIPKGVLYPMCSMNVAFNKKLIGPAFMQGLMGDGQPWARYDDMFAGWASKVVADHLSIGVKSGAPYIRHNKASNPFTNLKKEYLGLFWQEEVIKFMSNVKMSAASNTPSKAYLELADLIESALSSTLHPYFGRLAQAMRLWITEWKKRFGDVDDYDCYDPAQSGKKEFDVSCLPVTVPVASRSSYRKHITAPTGSKKDSTSKHEAPANTLNSTCAIFTIVHNEALYLPIWLRYYMRHIPAEDIWILDHNTMDGSTDPSKIPTGVHVRKLYGEAAWMPHFFLNRQVELHIQRLLAAGYPCVVFVESDEFIAPLPEKYPHGLKQYLYEYMHNPNAAQSLKGKGHHVMHVSQGKEQVEKDVDWSKPLLAQRHYMIPDAMYNKPVIHKIPIRYTLGHHFGRTRVQNLPLDDPDLLMFHTHFMDYKTCSEHEETKFTASRKRGKDNFGMNGYSVRFAGFKDLVASEPVCGMAMTSVVGGNITLPFEKSTVKGAPVPITTSMQKQILI